jgi:hypothetical protein
MKLSSMFVVVMERFAIAFVLHSLGQDPHSQVQSMHMPDRVVCAVLCCAGLRVQHC